MAGDVNVTAAENVIDVEVGDDTVLVQIGHTGPQGAQGPAGSGGGPAKTYIQQADPGAQAIEYLWVELDGSGNVKTFWIYTP